MNTQLRFSPEETLLRVLKVCRMSGYRRLGVQKRIQENMNFLHVVDERIQEIINDLLWFKENIVAIQVFFRDILEIFHGSIPSDADIKNSDYEWYINRMLHLCGKSGEHLYTIQNKNRILLIVIKNIPWLSKNIGFTESWIEDHEMFFEDLFHALEHVFKKHKVQNTVIPWIGREYEEYLLFQHR